MKVHIISQHESEDSIVIATFESECYFDRAKAESRLADLPEHSGLYYRLEEMEVTGDDPFSVRLLEMRDAMAKSSCTTKKGYHDLIPVFSTDASCPGASTVVRWCTSCGALVIDTDYDGRTKAGDVMEMRFPALTTKVHSILANDPG